MPIISLEGPEAVRIRKQNEYATWGSRNEENRVEPITNPAFDVPFRLNPGESIYTIGSCFARNVEGELLRSGFRIPVRELFAKPEFSELPTEIVNNFGTPSIFNEFAWAFGVKEYDEATNIVEVSKDKYVDLHMVNSIRPAALQLVRDRRRGLIDATRTLADCRVMIMTLGLVELWWDELSGNYLNTAPLPTLLKQWPNRFALHVLSYSECYDYLRNALDIAFKNAREDLSVILTISPVPMMATHRNMDVITANCYSKSALRTVAEQLIADDNRITYFPSYETISLSNREFSWSDDFVHVNKKMIALNVERMVNAFTGKEKRTAAILADLDVKEQEPADALHLAEQARIARVSGDSEFFKEHSDAAISSSAFALEYAKFLYDAQDYEKVLQVAEKDGRTEMTTLKARTLIAMGEAEAAREVIRPVCLQELKGIDHWRAYIDAIVAMQSKPALLEAEKEWLKWQPRNKGIIQAMIGRALRLMGDNEQAVDRLIKAAALPNRHIGTVIECAFCLVALKRHEEAAELLKGVVGNTDWQINRIARLKNQIENALK